MSGLLDGSQSIAAEVDWSASIAHAALGWPMLFTRRGGASRTEYI